MSVESTAKLFTPIRIGDVQLRHRIVLAPLTRLRVDPSTNAILPMVKEYYEQRASTPGTFLITEGTVIAEKAGVYKLPTDGTLHSSKPRLGSLHSASPGIWSDAQIVAWREVTDAVHERGSFIYCQLFAMGRAATAPELADPNVDFDLISASAIPLPGETIIPRAMTIEDIQEYVQLFVQAAKNAVQRAGFDGVEVHAANGYLLDAFLQDTANQRTDIYGGSPENRTRLLLEIVTATARAIGESKVGVRISPWSTFQGMLMADPIPTFTHLVRALREFPRLAYLHMIEPRVVGDSDVDVLNHSHSNEFIRDLWGGRTLISAGGYNRATALDRAERGEIIAFGRAFLANPDLPVRLEKNIHLTKGDRRTYYSPTAEGYTTYPVAKLTAAPELNLNAFSHRHKSQQPSAPMTARTKPRGRRRPMQLPPEICAKICESVGRKDLVTLCRTCRLFGHQAQRLIYRTVDLSHRTPRALRSWCSAVTRHPELAERVHALSLGLPSDLSFSSDAAKIARALSKCVNLKELSIHPDDSGPFGARYESKSSSIQGWIITKCPFRLTKFSNSYFKLSFIAQFWTPQSDIRVLGIPTCTTEFPLYDDQLPNLIALEVGDVSALPVDRPLQRIQLRWGRYVAASLDQLSVLGRYSATLTTLNLLQTTVTQRISTRQILEKVARCVPGLLHLGITETDEYTKASVADRFSDACPINVLAKFTKMETFVLYCQTITGFHDPILAHTYELNKLPSLRIFGLAIMNACPTLRRADIGSRIYPPTDDFWYHTRSERNDLACTLTRRSSTGEVEDVCAMQFDFHAVAMFM
ncbi:hypothetical protein B0H12DRAFT_1223150 [Mycena haematopus]|nr:hypothetical protein B0H12DRAFT_1223150 [Mycena haematopus]